MMSIFALFYPLSSKSYGQADASGHGVYDLNGMEEDFRPAVLEAPIIRGLSPRVKWSTVEPAEGRYNWSYLDGVFQLAAKYNKKIILRVHPGVFTPEWVYQAGAQRLQQPGRSVSMPAPWDPVYLTKWTNFVKVLGSHYGSHPSLYIVAVAGPTMGSVEFHLLGPKPAWERAGYTPAKVLDAWKACIDAFAQAFPNKAVALNITFQILGNQELPRQIISYGLDTYGRRVFLQGNWLSVDTPAQRLSIMRDYSKKTTVGFQMLGTSERMKGLRKAIENALVGGASYLEIYQSDLIKAKFKADIQYAASQLQIPADQRKAGLSPETFRSQDLTWSGDLEEGMGGSPEGRTAARQLMEQLRQAKQSALNRDLQAAAGELQNARNTLDILREQYPQASGRLLEAQTKLDQTVDSINRRDFRQARQLYRETLQILKAAKREVLSP